MRFAWGWEIGWHGGWHGLAGWDEKGIRALWDWIGEEKAYMITPFFLNYVACGALALIFISACKSSSQINIHLPSDPQTA